LICNKVLDNETISSIYQEVKDAKNQKVEDEAKSMVRRTQWYKNIKEHTKSGSKDHRYCWIWPAIFCAGFLIWYLYAIHTPNKVVAVLGCIICALFAIFLKCRHFQFNELLEDLNAY
jgi:hypothetical protein